MTITIDLTERALATLMGVSPGYAHRLVAAGDSKQIGKQIGKQIKGVKSVIINAIDGVEVSSQVSKMVSKTDEIPSSLNNPNLEENNKENNILKEKEKDVTTPPPTPSTPTRMKRPTQEEVTTYIREKGYNIDPIAFFNHYKANGWVQGKGKPIKDWKACCVTWERRRKAERSSTTGIIIRDDNDKQKYSNQKLQGW